MAGTVPGSVRRAEARACERTIRHRGIEPSRANSIEAFLCGSRRIGGGRARDERAIEACRRGDSDLQEVESEFAASFILSCAPSRGAPTCRLRPTVSCASPASYVFSRYTPTARGHGSGDSVASLSGGARRRRALRCAVSSRSARCTNWYERLQAKRARVRLWLPDSILLRILSL